MKDDQGIKKNCVGKLEAKGTVKDTEKEREKKN